MTTVRAPAHPPAPVRSRASLGRRLALLLLPLILAPTLAIGAAGFLRSRALLREQASDQLTGAAQTKLRPLLERTEELEFQLGLTSQNQDIRSSIATLLTAARGSPEFSAAAAASLDPLGDLEFNETQRLFSRVLLARASDGLVLVSSDGQWEGSPLPALVEMRPPTNDAATRPVFDDALLDPGGLALVSSAPVRPSEGGQPHAFLIGVNSGLQVGGMMREMVNVWELRGFSIVEPGRTFLALEPDILLHMATASMLPTAARVGDHPVFAAAGEAPSGALEYANAQGVPLLAAYEWLPDWHMGVVVELPQAEVFGRLDQLAAFMAAVLLVASLRTIASVAFTTNRTIRPLADLTRFAERLSQGDLQHRVEAPRPDEVGRLAGALNFMADELSALYTSLEQRVRERTHQIRTAAEVARDAVATRDVARLLEDSVRVISERFGFYHVGVFLIDDTGEQAVLRAASSPGGKRLLARGHRLPVGKVGVVGYVTGTGKHRIASDVGRDPVHFANPELPDTRSELALPLRSGEKLLGALDVQSVDPNAFAEEDVLVLQTMADQLGVAIENARLLEEQSTLASQRSKVLELYRWMTEQVGYDALLTSIAAEVRRAFGYRSVSLGLVEGDQVVTRASASGDQSSLARLGEATAVGRGALGRAVAERSAVLAGRPGAVPGGPPTSVLAVPLLSRGQVIGALSVESQVPPETLGRDRETLELLAGQTAVSLENTRLFEETQANLERLDALYRQQTTQAWAERLASLRGRREGGEGEYGQARGDPTVQAPIELRGEVIGRLDLAPSRPGEWSLEEEEIVKAVAEEVAGALEQARLMEEVQRRAFQLQAAAEIARESASFLNLEDLLGRSVTLIRERMGFPYAAVALLDPQGRRTLVAASPDRPKARAESPGRLDEVLEDLLRRAARSNSLERIPDLTRDGHAGPGSALGAPLRIGESMIGLLCIRHDRPHSISEDDVSVFGIIADQLAVAVQNARLFAETLRRAEREQAVVEISGKIRASPDVESMLQTALAEMRKTLGARQARVVLPPPRPGEGGDEPRDDRGNGDGGPPPVGRGSA